MDINDGRANLTTNFLRPTAAGTVDCLRFRYLLEADRLLELSVSVQQQGQDHTDKLWVAFSKTKGWADGACPVSVHGIYRVSQKLLLELTVFTYRVSQKLLLELTVFTYRVSQKLLLELTVFTYRVSQKLLLELTVFTYRVSQKLLLELTVFTYRVSQKLLLELTVFTYRVSQKLLLELTVFTYRLLNEQIWPCC